MSLETAFIRLLLPDSGERLTPLHPGSNPLGAAIIEVIETPNGYLYLIKSSDFNCKIYVNRMLLAHDSSALLNYGDGIIVDNVPYRLEPQNYEDND